MRTFAPTRVAVLIVWQDTEEITLSDFHQRSKHDSHQSEADSSCYLPVVILFVYVFES